MKPAMTRPVDLPVTTEKQFVREEGMVREGESLFAEVLSSRVSREGLRQDRGEAEAEVRPTETEDARDGLALMLADTERLDDKKMRRVKSPVLGMVADHEMTLKSDQRLAAGLLTRLSSRVAQRATTAQGLRKMLEAQGELTASQTARQKAGELAQSRPLKEAVKLLERAEGHRIAREPTPPSEVRAERIVEREQAARDRVKETSEATTKRPNSAGNDRVTSNPKDRVRLANQRSEAATHLRERARALVAKAALRTSPLQRVAQGATPQAQRAVAATVATRLVQPPEESKARPRVETRPAASSSAVKATPDLPPAEGAQVAAAAQGSTEVAPTQQVGAEAPVAAAKTAQDVMQMADQLIDQLDRMISKRADVSHKLTVQLGKELGEVKLAVQMNARAGTSMHVTLEAAEAQTATLLKSAVTAISDGLKDKGYVDPVIKVGPGHDAEAAKDNDADDSRGQKQRELNEQAEAYLAAIGRRTADRGDDK